MAIHMPWLYTHTHIYTHTHTHTHTMAFIDAFMICSDCFMQAIALIASCKQSDSHTSTIKLASAA